MNQSLTAKAAFDLMMEIAGIKGKRFFTRIIELCKEQLPPEVSIRDPRPDMSHREAHIFEQELMPFGQYKAVPIGEIPTEYLAFLSDDAGGFKANLHRYVRSKRFRDRQDQETEL